MEGTWLGNGAHPSREEMNTSVGCILFVAVAAHTPAGNQELGEKSELGGVCGGAQRGWGEVLPTPGMLTEPLLLIV